MKTTYSRREVYALGEPLGESVTRVEAGRRVYGGGGGGLGGIVSGITDAVSDVAGGIGDLASGAVDTVKDVASDVRDPLETAAVLAGNYFVPGSSIITSKLVSDNAQDMLNTDLGKLAQIGSSGAGGMEGNLSNWNPSNWGSASSGVTGLGDASAWDAATADMAPGGLDPYDIYGSGASQWGGSGDYMDLAAVSGTDLGGAGGSPASWVSDVGGISQIAKMLGKSISGDSNGLTYGGGLLGAAGLAGLMNMIKEDNKRYGTPGRQDVASPLSQFKYSPAMYSAPKIDPAAFRPAGMPTAKIGYASGGSIENMSNANSVGQNTGYPMANIQQGAYATPWQTPVSRNVVSGAQDVSVDPYTGEETRYSPAPQASFASGGISNLGSYSDGGRMLKGPGDGMSDSIPASISGKQPARLADGEFVVPADVVSHLGNGSTDAGAKQLYKMMDKVRTARTGRKAQGREINPKKYMPV